MPTQQEQFDQFIADNLDLQETLRRKAITDAEDQKDIQNLIAWNTSKAEVDTANREATRTWEQSVTTFNEGIRDRDAGFSSYLEAGNLASDFVDTELAQERSNAALLGIDFNFTQEQRQGRISDKFGQIWSEENQEELDALFTEFGAAEGFTNWSFQRGAGTGFYDVQQGSDYLVSASTGQKNIDQYEFFERPEVTEEDGDPTFEWDTRTFDDYGPTPSAPELGDLLEYDEKPGLTKDQPGGSVETFAAEDQAAYDAWVISEAERVAEEAAAAEAKRIADEEEADARNENWR